MPPHSFSTQKQSSMGMNIRPYEIADLEQIGSLFDEFILLNTALAY
jgi:hypothetical protein